MLGAGAAPAAAAPTTTINFDDVTAPCDFSQTSPLTTQYSGLGVTFAGPAVLQGGAILNSCGNFGVSGFSAPNFLAFNTSDYATGPETISFSPAVSSVSIREGGATGGTFTITAYDGATQVGTVSAPVTAALSTQTVSATRITRVVISFTGPTLVLDDLVFVAGGPSADLSLTKSSTPNPAIAGQQVTYTVTAHNAGPDTAVNAVIVDTLPAGTTFQGASPGCTFNPNVGSAGTVTCALGDLASGATVTRQIVVLAGAGSPVNSAVVSSDTADPNATNNTTTTTTTVGSSCTVTRTGSISGSIVVPAGQFLCLVNATVGGAVIVNPGGALTSTNSTIRGSVGSNRAVFVTLCGSTLGGVVIKNTTLLVRVGDDDSACAPNHLRGALVVAANKGGVEVFGNTIGGSLSVSGNSGGSPLADGASEVEGNTIGGALQCQGNAPAPTNDGITNHARGAELNQCVGL